MAYIRTKKIKGNTYYYLVKSQRINGKVKQTVVGYLGTEKPSPEKTNKIRAK